MGDYIVIRHRVTKPPLPARHYMLDAVLVINAEGDSDALRAASEHVPQPTATEWNVLPVTTVDAAR